MGVGYSYLGVKLLLTSRETKSRIAAILCFVTGSLRAVRSETDPGLSHWYREHSQVYIAKDHLCWSDENYTRKVRKNRFGKAVESSEDGLNRMLNKHMAASTEWLGEMMGLGEDKSEEEVETTTVAMDFGHVLPGRGDMAEFVQT